jgi:Ca2+-transporting ATPase
MGITFYQERKTERALEALRELASPRAQVWRDGEWQFVPGREVVLGDLVRLKEGDRVPADAALLKSSNLMADESLLTGESVPVRKRATRGRGGGGGPGGDDLPYVFSGTLLTQGQASRAWSRTGVHTEIGKIGQALQTLVPELSAIQRETRRAVVFFAVIGMALCVLVTVLYGLLRGDWLNGLLAGITLAMANLPEEFPVVLTVFLALGAWRISQHGVLTRRAPAIETLGSTTCCAWTRPAPLRRTAWRCAASGFPAASSICSRRGRVLPDLVELSVLASEREPFDPMEKAYHRLAHERAPAAVEKLGAWTLAHSYPLTPAQLSVAHVWQPHGSDGMWWRPKAPGGDRRACARSTRPGARPSKRRSRGWPATACVVLAVAKGTLSRRPRVPSVAFVAEHSSSCSSWGSPACRSHSADRAGSLTGMLRRRNTHRDDHGRLPRHGDARSHGRSASRSRKRSMTGRSSTQ